MMFSQGNDGGVKVCNELGRVRREKNELAQGRLGRLMTINGP